MEGAEAEVPKKSNSNKLVYVLASISVRSKLFYQTVGKVLDVFGRISYEADLIPADFAELPMRRSCTLMKLT